MEQFVILLIIAAISLINWLLQKSADHKKQRELLKQDVPPGSADEPAPWEIPDGSLLERERHEPVADPFGAPTGRRAKAPDAEEQMRRFFDALGLPVPEPENPPVATPALVNAPPPLPKPVPAPMAFHKPTLRENREMRELAAEFERNAIDLASDTGTQAAFRNLLDNPHEVRQGIILREILGPPKAFEY
jgi:hypothetical protein